MADFSPIEKIVALVPLRGGSKSIPLKNIKEIGGKPLCSWTLEALEKCRQVQEVYVSTDSDRIAHVVRKRHPRTQILDRPAKYATDEATTESVMLHFAQNVDFDVLITAQVTSPLVTDSDFGKAIHQMEKARFDSMVTGVRTKRFFWDLDGTPLNYDPGKRPRRQDFDGIFMENGAFYITRREILINEQSRLGGKIGVYEMGAETELEIDEPEDWIAVEKLLRAGYPTGKKDIRVLVCDVDGTLTDGGMYYGAEGEALKKFNTRDAMGLRFLREAGVDVWIITGENSPSVIARMKKLGLTECHFGVEDKAGLLTRLCEKKNIGLEHVAYIGDDVNDLQCMRIAGLSACPGDAVEAVKEIVSFKGASKAGEGAVREFCDYLLQGIGHNI